MMIGSEDEKLNRCWFCTNHHLEILSHVFLRSFIANRTWFYYYFFVGPQIRGISLREVIMLWWGAGVKKEVKTYYKVVPSIIISKFLEIDGPIGFWVGWTVGPIISFIFYLCFIWTIWPILLLSWLFD